eukprot:4091137-Pleurochrysis_carterae.AAC.1
MVEVAPKSHRTRVSPCRCSCRNGCCFTPVALLALLTCLMSDSLGLSRMLAQTPGHLTSAFYGMWHQRSTRLCLR